MIEEILYRIATIVFIWSIIWALLSFWVVGFEFFIFIISVPLLGLFTFWLTQDLYRSKSRIHGSEKK